MAHRELNDWEKCDRSAFTGAHGWSLIVEKKSRMSVAEGVRCEFCGGRPPLDQEQRLFDWMFAQEEDRRRSQSTPFRAAFQPGAA